MESKMKKESASFLKKRSKKLSLNGATGAEKSVVKE
jgi:hypothetical protein